MAKSRTLKLSILGDVDNLNKSLKSATKDVDTFGDKMGKVGKVVGAALAAATVAAGAFAVKIGIEAVKAASDLEETVSKVGVIFGDTSKEIERFAEGAASSLGQTKQQALDAAATFATFGKAAGLSGQDLGKFSTEFVTLASDLASFNNTSPEQAINAIGSALRGEAEPLRAYGVLLDDASLRQAAFSLGIIDSTKNALTPQQKVLAAQKLIFEQTGLAQGDFARTSDGLANKTRILTAQLDNAKVTIGEALLPVVTQIATYIGNVVVPNIVSFVNALTGKGSLEEATETSSAAAFRLGENVRKFISIIIALKDELLIVGGVLVATFAVSRISAAVMASVALIKTLITAYNALKATAIVTGVATAFALNPLLGVGAVALAAGVLAGANALAGRNNVDTSSLGVASSAGFSGTMPGGQSFTTGTTARTVVPTVPTVPGVTGATGGVTAAARVAASAAASTGITSSFDPGRFRMADNAGMGTTINLNVTGAIDKEGTARTIVDTLNNSFYRGTGGATNLQIA